MEQIKIIFEIVLSGFALTFIQYFTSLNKKEVQLIMEKFNILGSVIYKVLALICFLMLSIAIYWSVTNDLNYVDAKNSIASFFVLGVISLVFSYSFVPPKRILFIKIS